MKTVIFCRVSSKEQEETGYSLPAQEKALKDYCTNRGLEHVKIFSISESASGSKQRKIFNAMLKYLYDNSITNLVVEKTDRLTRNLSDSVIINTWLEKDSNRNVHFVKENFVLNKDSRSNDKFIWNIKVSAAQYYIDNLSEEVKKGQKEKLAQGWLPTKPPIGYKTVGDKGKRIHVIDDDTKHFALKMFTQYASGLCSVKKLADLLYEDGLRSEYGNKVPTSRIHTFLRDPFYIGKNRWNGRIYDGNQEPLIERDMFELVQKRLTGKNTPKYGTHNYLLKGIIRCKECGGTITWEKQREFLYGHCNHYKNCSQQKWSKETDVEDQYLNVFDGLKVENARLLDWIRRALKDSNKVEDEYYSTSLQALTDQEKLIKKRMSTLYDDKVDGRITPGFYDQKYAEYSQDQDIVLDKIAKLNKAGHKSQNLKITLYEVAQDARGAYERAKKVEKKRIMLKTVFKNMWLDEGKLTYEHTEVFDLLAKAVKETNNSSKAPEIIDYVEKSFEQGVFSITEAKKELSMVGHSIWLPR